MRTFSNKELQYFKEALMKFKTPAFPQFIFKYWFKYIKYIILPIFILILLLGVSYLIWKVDTIFEIMKIVFTLLGIYIVLLWFAKMYEDSYIKYYQKKLKLDDEEWNYLVNLFNIER